MKWRENRDEFIPKAGKMNHNTAKDYNPKSFYCKDIKMFIIATFRLQIVCNDAKKNSDVLVF